MNVAPSAPLVPASSVGGELSAASLGDGHLPWAFMGYEQLLNIQQQQHRLEIEQKEAENAHLKTCLDFVEKRHSGAGAAAKEVADMLKTQEQAATLLMASKHKELELMAGLLQVREQQIEDFRKLCEAQSREIEELKKRQSSGDVAGSDTVGPLRNGAEQHLQSSSPQRKDDHQQLQQEVRRLRLRMEELEAAVGEQNDRSAGLAHELHVKSEQVKVWRSRSAREAFAHLGLHGIAPFAHQLVEVQ